MKWGKSTQSEHNFQFNVVSYLRMSGYIVFETDVMDGLKFCGRDEKTRMAYIIHHRKMGYILGQPDLVILAKGGRCIFAELKTPTGKQSSEQKEFQRLAELYGSRYELWRSIEDVVNFVKEDKKCQTI